MFLRLAADATLVLHLAFILFACLGALLVARWRRVAWVHLPCAAWGFLVEAAGWICPLTYVENCFRRLAGDAGYAGGFVERYLLPVVYPAGLTREVQYALAAVVVVLNVALYAWVLRRKR